MTGVQTCALPIYPDAARRTNLLQTWIFPDKKNITPRYGQRTFPASERINKLQTLVSPIDNEDAGLKIHQSAWIYRTTLEGGKTVTHTLHSAQHGAYIFMIDGKATVGGQVLGRRDALGIAGDEHFDITAESTSDILIFEVPMR